MSGIIGSAFRRAYRELITDRTAQAPFWILVGFLPTFITARYIVKSSPDVYLNVHGVHVHHFTYGIFALAISGFISIALPQHRLHRWLAVLYGLGLALSFDEFGMWLRLTANYNLSLSADVMFGLLTFLIVAVYFTGLIRRVFKYLPQGWRREVKRELADKAHSMHSASRSNRR